MCDQKTSPLDVTNRREYYCIESIERAYEIEKWLRVSGKKSDQLLGLEKEAKRLKRLNFENHSYDREQDIIRLNNEIFNLHHSGSIDINDPFLDEYGNLYEFDDDVKTSDVFYEFMETEIDLDEDLGDESTDDVVNENAEFLIKLKKKIYHKRRPQRAKRLYEMALYIYDQCLMYPDGALISYVEIMGHMKINREKTIQTYFKDLKEMDLIVVCERPIKINMKDEYYSITPNRYKWIFTIKQ